MRQGVVEHSSRQDIATPSRQASRHGGFAVSRSSSLAGQGGRRLGVVKHVFSCPWHAHEVTRGITGECFAYRPRRLLLWAKTRCELSRGNT